MATTPREEFVLTTCPRDCYDFFHKIGATEVDPDTVCNKAGHVALVMLSVAISDDVPRGVALVHKGRWPKLDPSHANLNVLNPGRKSDMGESSAVHAVEVEITHAD